MRNLQIAVGLAIFAVLSLANTARAQTLESKILTTMFAQESVVENMNVAAHEFCSPAKDAKFHRTTAVERESCIREHAQVILLSRVRMAAEIRLDAAIWYKDPASPQYAKERDAARSAILAKNLELQRKYAPETIKTGMNQ